MSSPLTEADRRLLADRGISEREAERQLSLLRDPPAPAALDRAATAGDGIERFGDDGESERLEGCRRVLEEGRVTRFVPASGAATRMFRDLLEELDDQNGPVEAIERLVAELPKLPFDALLARAIDRCGITPDSARADTPASRRLVREILHGNGDDPGLAGLPKGLIPFHRYPARGATSGSLVLTPVEEHLAEARDLAGTKARLHFTVAPEHEERFASRLRDFDASIPFDFSHQLPATDTLALDEHDAPLRDERGELVLRPGGHGALIGNLERAPTDLVAIRNVDNVLPSSRRDQRQLWNRRLIGDLACLEERVHGALELLHRHGDASAARRLADELELGARTEEELDQALDRPLRVCAMVENLGEPGGGPFWVREDDGRASLQIVEASQIDHDHPVQAEIASRATHFNPTDLVCSLRRWDGSRFRLEDLVDEGTSFVAAKSHRGQPIRALERPGLWNGAMAGWLSRFVELPASTFAPVKTVWDLLRPEHQPAESASPS